MCMQTFGDVKWLPCMLLGMFFARLSAPSRNTSHTIRGIVAFQVRHLGVAAVQSLAIEMALEETEVKGIICFLPPATSSSV